MRKLTLLGFLSEYVRELSGENTLSISKLYKNMHNRNSRLKEPFFLYCYYSGKSKLLMKHLNPDEINEYNNVCEYIMTEDYKSMPLNYQKAYESYKYQTIKHDNETRIKSLMVKKIEKIQAEKKISNYRIYTDLHLNPGNFNDFIKNKNYNKLSLDKSSNVLEYLERA